MMLPAQFDRPLLHCTACDSTPLHCMLRAQYSPSSHRQPSESTDAIWTPSHSACGPRSNMLALRPATVALFSNSVIVLPRCRALSLRSMPSAYDKPKLPWGSAEDSHHQTPLLHFESLYLSCCIANT
jgi:hypothetical protein